MAHTVKGCDGEEEEDVDVAAPVGALSVYCCGSAEESKGGDGEAAATVAHAVKGGDGEEEENVGTAAALP